MDLTTIVQQYGKDTSLAVLGIIGGGIISFYFYRRSLQRDETSFACEYIRLIWSRIPAFSNITLSYSGEPIHDPRRVLFYFWNSGNTTIDGSRIAAADPLRLEAGDVRINNAAIVSSTRKVNCSSVEKNDNGDIKLLFDFLDPGDGFVVEVLYDVVEKEKRKNTCPDLVGTIKGIKNPSKQREISFENRTFKRIGQSTAFMLTTIASIVLLIFQVYEIADTARWFLIIPKSLTALLLLLLAVGMIFALVSTLRSYKIPMSLKPDDDSRFPTGYNELVDDLEFANARFAAQTAMMLEDSEKIAKFDRIKS